MDWREFRCSTVAVESRKGKEGGIMREGEGEGEGGRGTGEGGRGKGEGGRGKGEGKRYFDVLHGSRLWVLKFMLPTADLILTSHKGRCLLLL